MSPLANKLGFVEIGDEPLMLVSYVLDLHRSDARGRPARGLPDAASC